MYSSFIDAIIHQEEFMIIPIDDHLIHRGHGVTTNMIISSGRIYNLSQNIEYLFEAARKVKITPKHSEKQACQIVHDLVSSTQKQNLLVQVYITAGTGNMMIVPLQDMSSLYVTAWDLDLGVFNESLNEHFIEFPISNEFQSQVQNSHYLVNVLCRENSKEQGGRFGILLNDSGCCLEGGLVIPVLVTNENKVVFSKSSNPFPVLFRIESILRNLQAENVVGDVEFRTIHKDEFFNARELFIIGQDFIFPVKTINNTQIGEEDLKSVVKLIQAQLIADYTSPSFSVPVDYSLYN
jgi:branched-chain amino acid aminotransferase